MAFVGSGAFRHKTTTYGKHSRRLVSTLSSATEIEFPQDTSTSVADHIGTIQNKQGDSRTASSYKLHGYCGTKLQSENLSRQAMSDRSKHRDQHRSSLSCSDSAKGDSLYHLPLSDDAAEHDTNAARKRRKVVTSSVIVDKYSPVYDDESLQRHIAAEARRDKRQIVHASGTTSAMQDSESWPWAAKSQTAARCTPKKVMSNTSRDPAMDLKHGIDAKVAEQTKDPSVTQKYSKGLLKPGVTSYHLQNSRMDPAQITARPMTHTTVSDRAYSQKATSDPSLYTLEMSVTQPTTPPRPPRSVGRATTPRQRELWDRLLVDNPQAKSPLGLDLVGFEIGETVSNDSSGHSKSRQISRRSHQQSAAFKARPNKIVDTLHQSDQDRDHISDDCDELLGSSSSDNKSEYMQSEVSAADGAITMQTSSSADSQGLVSQFQDRSCNASQTIPSLYGGGLKVTYGRQRSYLTDNDLEEAAIAGLSVAPEPKNRRRYGQRQLGDRAPILQSVKSLEKEFGDLTDSQGGTMRSIHELREAGGNVRLLSELEAILDDIGDYQPGSTSKRRSKLIDLNNKLDEPATCRLFVDQGLESRLMADVDQGNDLITNSLVVAALLQLMAFSSSTSLLTLVSDVRVVRFLIGLLGSDQDILSHARRRGNNMSMAVQSDLKALCSALLRSTAWRAGKPSMLSCHVLSLQCLDYLVRQTREAGSLFEVLSAHAIRRIVATSVPRFSPLPPEPAEMSINCLELAVSILESCTISDAAECQASLWAGETLERLVGLLPLLSLWGGEECGTSRTLTLRLYLNLTNNSPDLCEDFSTPEVISGMFGIVILNFEQLADKTLETDKTLLLDDLILSLGSLINLAELSQIARQSMMDLRYRSQSYLDSLLELFMKRSKNAAEVRTSSAKNDYWH